MISITNCMRSATLLNSASASQKWSGLFNDDFLFRFSCSWIQSAVFSILSIFRSVDVVLPNIRFLMCHCHSFYRKKIHCPLWLFIVKIFADLGKLASWRCYFVYLNSVHRLDSQVKTKCFVCQWYQMLLFRQIYWTIFNQLDFDFDSNVFLSSKL